MSDVVILSPYREQRSKITELLKGAYDDIQVTTVTKSQGKMLKTKHSNTNDLVNKILIKTKCWRRELLKPLRSTTIQGPFLLFGPAFK